MEATITTIGDVFNKKVDDIITESYDAPTIWVDSRTGEEHEDYVNTQIESKDPNSSEWNICSSKDESCYIVHKQNGPDTLIVNGPIKQVGSHVIECGPLFDSEQEYPFLDQLDKVFKYARNLERCFSLFNFWQPKNGFTVPENLFWNCTKLKELFNIFFKSTFQEIPPMLLERCPNLESVNCLFYDTLVEEIPEDLFKNNLKITNFESVFGYTEIKKIPDKLLDQFKDGLNSKKIAIYDFLDSTPIKNKIMHLKDAAITSKEKEIIRAQYIPSYLTREVQWDMMGIPGDCPENF